MLGNPPRASPSPTTAPPSAPLPLHAAAYIQRAASTHPTCMPDMLGLITFLQCHQNRFTLISAQDTPDVQESVDNTKYQNANKRSSKCHQSNKNQISPTFTLILQLSIMKNAYFFTVGCSSTATQSSSPNDQASNPPMTQKKVSSSGPTNIQTRTHTGKKSCISLVCFIELFLLYLIDLI